MVWHQEDSYVRTTRDALNRAAVFLSVAALRGETVL